MYNTHNTSSAKNAPCNIETIDLLNGVSLIVMVVIITYMTTSYF